jgi:serine/threonine protein kinase
LQVALGMDHLHKRHMLHRDLKSANVLLDEDFKAKVCDFGLSRMANPVRRRIVHSSFTGMTRLLPATLFSADVGCGLPSLDMINVGVSVEDAHGNMTKAAGTQLWMAPEVFRGDDSYTPAVDVYSDAQSSVGGRVTVRASGVLYSIQPCLAKGAQTHHPQQRCNRARCVCSGDAAVLGRRSS